MPTFIPSDFCQYELDEREALEGQIFSSSQLAVLQNHLSAAAKEKLDHPFDPHNPQVFMQREAELTGQIEILRMLINMSNDLQAQMEEHAALQPSESVPKSTSPFDGATYTTNSAE